MRDNCVQVAKKLPVIYYYIIIPTTYNFDGSSYIDNYSHL